MKPHHRIFFIQFAVALSLGAFVSRLPDLQLKFSLTEGELGLLLAVLSSGVLCGLTFSVSFIERFGARTMAGKAAGRGSPGDTTLFCSVGLAGTEVVVASAILDML